MLSPLPESPSELLPFEFDVEFLEPAVEEAEDVELECCELDVELGVGDIEDVGLGSTVTSVEKNVCSFLGTVRHNVHLEINVFLTVYRRREFGIIQPD
jgi:hypothetical protein